MEFSFRKCHRRRSFLPKHSGFSLIRALFTLVGEGINFKPLHSKEISALEIILFTFNAYAFCNLNTILQFRTILFKGIIQSA